MRLVEWRVERTCEQENAYDDLSCHDVCHVCHVNLFVMFIIVICK